MGGSPAKQWFENALPRRTRPDLWLAIPALQAIFKMRLPHLLLLNTCNNTPAVLEKQWKTSALVWHAFGAAELKFRTVLAGPGWKRRLEAVVPGGFTAGRRGRGNVFLDPDTGQASGKGTGMVGRQLNPCTRNWALSHIPPPPLPCGGLRQDKSAVVRTELYNGIPLRLHQRAVM